MSDSYVLLVDDGSDFLASLRQRLADQRPDWEVRVVIGAASAMEAMAEGAFDAVVTGVEMSGASGLDLLGVIRQAPRTAELPVVIAVDNADHEARARSFEAGATDLLTKPIRIEELILRLQNVLRLKSRKDEIETLRESLDKGVKERTQHVERSRIEVLWRLAKAGEYRDEATGNHTVRVGCYSRLLAERLGLDGELVRTIALASPLHDIGKIGIDDEVLRKPGPLDAGERWLIERHCAIGAEFLLEAPKGLGLWLGPMTGLTGRAVHEPVIRCAAEISLYHHERWDGSGYPNGLSKREIPISARIVGITDMYDALVSDRPYRAELSDRKALEIMKAEHDRHFDPKVFEIFVNAFEEIRCIRSECSDSVFVAG